MGIWDLLDISKWFGWGDEDDDEDTGLHFVEDFEGLEILDEVIGLGSYIAFEVPDAAEYANTIAAEDLEAYLEGVPEGILVAVPIGDGEFFEIYRIEYEE